MSDDGQYADGRNLSARQRLWACARPGLDLVGWVLGLAGVRPGEHVLEVGCGNGQYLDRLAGLGFDPFGVDLSVGMLRDSPHSVAAADAVALPFPTASFDVVLAPHMLYHVPDRTAAVRELRRVLRPTGRCLAVTNGDKHIASIRDLVRAVVRPEGRGWRPVEEATATFSVENGARQLRTAFDDVRLERPVEAGVVRVRDAGIVADYVASLADDYPDEPPVSWSEIVSRVRRRVGEIIDWDGCFETRGDVGCFVCR